MAITQPQNNRKDLNRSKYDLQFFLKWLSLTSVIHTKPHNLESYSKS